MTKDSPTGRGYTQGSDSYRADDVAKMSAEQDKWDDERPIRAIKEILAITHDAGCDRIKSIQMVAEQTIRQYEMRPPKQSRSINEPLPMEPWR